DLVRERLGPRVALANLAGSLLVTVLTLGAEIGGVGLALQLATSVDYQLWEQASHPGPPHGEDWGTYWFMAVALFASAMTPYEVFFFSSGAVEERWTTKDLLTSRINVFLGFPLGGLLAFALMVCSALVFHPHGV